MVGMDLSQIDFRLRYEDDTVIADAVLLQGVTVDGTTLERGHVVRCFLSRRFQPQAAVALLQRGGWSTWRAELDDPGDHFAVLAVKD